MSEEQRTNGDALLAALFSSPAETANGKEGNVADALFAIARATEKLAMWVKYLGGGDNADNRGAVEFLAIKVEEGANRFAEAGHEIAAAIESLAEKGEQ
jgi:hypothetical protein